MAQLEAYGQAQKDFFIDMLTRDISLTDCILDLLDNCVDGAARELQRRRIVVSSPKRFEGFSARIEIARDKFSIADDCGGIPTRIAKDYAFAFGKREGSPEPKHSIGLYGIGMKRAIFKIGDVIKIKSISRNDSFETEINVPIWRAKEDNWSFSLTTGEGRAHTGTTITVTTLHDDVALDFNDAEFRDELERAISRDYMFILRKGFKIYVNGRMIHPLEVKLLSGEGYQAVRARHKLLSDKRGVNFEIIAGLWKKADPDDDDPEANVTVDPGWYVVCNDRVVLAGDTTSKTGWGVDKYIERKWHSQYKPFVGFAFFSSDEAELLPWTTTKRGVDLNSEVYRQGLVWMKEATESVIEYTNSRKANRVKAELAERTTPRVSLSQLPNRRYLRFPKFKTSSERLANVTYQVSSRRIQKVKVNMGDPTRRNSDVGLATFEYYYNHVIEG